MYKKVIYSFCWMTMGLLVMSCAPSAKVPVMRPAEINLRGVDKIVIGDIGGNAGRNYADLLTARLFETDKYEVLDRDNLARVMREHKLNASGAVDPSTAIKIGKIIGASALVAGNVNLVYRNKRWRGERWKDKKGNYHQNFSVKGVAKISANLKMIDLTTGRMLAVKAISTEASKSNCMDGQYPMEPDREALIGDATSESLDKFMKMIAPYTSLVTVKFDKAKSEEGKNAIGLAKNGLWKDALNLFETAKNNNPDHYGAWHNLGVCYQYNFMFQEAHNAFEECNKRKVSKKCVQGIREVKQMKKDHGELKNQGVNAVGLVPNTPRKNDDGILKRFKGFINSITE